MINKFLSRLLKGIHWGCTVLVLNIVIWELSNDAGASIIYDNFLFHATGYLLCGMALSFSQIILEFERFSSWIKIIIHILVLACAMLAFGFVFGWISLGEPVTVVVYMISFAVTYGAVWVGSYYYEKWQIRQVNEVLRSRDSGF